LDQLARASAYLKNRQMWPFRSRFRRGLDQHAITESPTSDKPDEGPTISISIYDLQIELLSDFDLGRLAALIFAQAERDGSSKVRLCFGKNGMFYTIGGVEYEMVPPPSAVTLDLVRALTREGDSPGKLMVRFADRTIELAVAIAGEPNDEYLEITGFTRRKKARIRVSA